MNYNATIRESDGFQISPLRKGKTWNLSQVGIILACLFFVVPLCGLPPTRFGYYNQVESCLIAFWALSGVACLWTYFLRKFYPRLVYHTFEMPIVWGPLLLGGATLLISPFHALPLRDFTGSPHIAEGALTFIASGIMASLFSILTRIPAYRKIICTAAFMSGLTLSILAIVGSMESPFISWRYWQWAPYVFPDFIAFIDISLAALYLYIRKDLKSKYLYDVLAFMLFVLITYYASNKSLGYGIIFSTILTAGIWLLPLAWKRNLLHLGFFGLSIALTLLIVFYDDFSKVLPEPLKFLGHLSTITSRTWLSKVTFINLVTDPLSWTWVQQLYIGQGWGTFSNISASNMFLIDQISMFTGKDYNPSWELVNRDLLHSHNVLTNYFHSVGIVGVSLYLYTQYKLINSLSKSYYLLGAAFLIAYQVQVLFWFQLMITIPFTVLIFSVLFKQRSPSICSLLPKPKLLIGLAAFLFCFSILQGVITWGYQKRSVHSTKESVRELTTAPYVRLEAYFGAQRQVALARLLATTLQEELKNKPQELMAQSLMLVHHLMTLPKGGNYLAYNVAINILSELASKPETLKLFSQETFKTWEDLAKDHVKFMPSRSDILLPFFNIYQNLGKENIVLDLTHEILEKYPQDPIALWFTGSSQLKSPSHFNEGMCMLQKSIHNGVERLMPIPPPLKAKIMTYAQTCP